MWFSMVVGMGFASAPLGPSFDCARASLPAEHAICADATLSMLDRGLAQAWAGARRRLHGDEAALRVLKSDQQLFLHARDLEVEGPDPDLSAFFFSRILWLESLSAAPSSFAGTYTNLHGELVVRETADGWAVDATAVEPTAGRWICETHTKVNKEGDGWVGQPTADAWGMRLRREGGVLWLEEIPSLDNEIRPHCGFRGSLDGAYLWSAPSNAK